MNTSNEWTREVLEGYIFIYVANADFQESYEEREIISEKIDAATSAKLHREFEKDNDNQSITKIQDAIARLGYTADEKKQLIEEIKKLLTADGQFDAAEKGIYAALKRVIV
ncbi:hypothetical protein [Patiriisocius marinus]|uniref:hypothetical protein n=1 Tax=Patiriisocius marinus TaxID=1397112 RepID=UPI00232C6D60|nr:hypothetical protein [Patiriisocius marinus]